jgi:hypothetical protein
VRDQNAACSYMGSLRAQTAIWCSQSLSLLCSGNDAVNVLPCSACAYLTVDPS